MTPATRTVTFPDRIKIACPQCGCALQGIVRSRVEVVTDDRHCLKCKTLWDIVVTPLWSSEATEGHRIDWTSRGAK